MRDDIRRTATPKDHLINEIIDIEWNMFDKVNNIGGRAGCQDDGWTFYVNRYSQFAIYNVDVLSMYREDLAEAQMQGRNLITEKYAYMMEFTDKANYDANLKAYMPVPSEEKIDLIEKILRILVMKEAEFAEMYPGISGNSRPITGVNKMDVSFMVYTIGELKTYSERTLKGMYGALEELIAKGVSPSYLIHRNTVEFYGYEDLDDAENKILLGRV
ncbi:MAG: DUF4125 family protein [Bacillota bacterium]|nr:DUF4125 family protein [Bacillota bacterium]